MAHYNIVLLTYLLTYLLFYPLRPEVVYATQSVALLTVLYDKPFQVLIKHCLRPAMLEMASDTHDSATHALYSTGLRSELTEVIKPGPLDQWTQEFHTAVTQLTDEHGEPTLSCRKMCHSNGTGG